jgi:hypothetical protein
VGKGRVTSASTGNEDERRNGWDNKRECRVTSASAGDEDKHGEGQGNERELRVTTTAGKGGVTWG